MAMISPASGFEKACLSWPVGSDFRCTHAIQLKTGDVDIALNRSLDFFTSSESLKSSEKFWRVMTDLP